MILSIAYFCPWYAKGCAVVLCKPPPKASFPVAAQTASSKYATFNAAVTDTTIATASAATGAVAGIYSLEVTALAQGHRLTSPDNTNVAGKAALTAGLAAGGTLKIELGTLPGATPRIHLIRRGN